MLHAQATQKHRAPVSFQRPGRTVVYHGMGSATTTAVSVGGSAGAAAATAVVSSIAASGGTILGIAASSLVPVVGPAIGLIVFGVQRLIANSGCGITCIETSQWADQAASLLQQNLDGYFSLPVPRPKSAQIVCLANYETIFQRLKQQCSDPSTGDAGRRCISDRQAGACTWRQNRTGGPPGEPAMGECWNWDNGYRAPIANDPNVYDDTAGGLFTGGLPDLLPGIGPSLYLPALAIALGVAFL